MPHLRFRLKYLYSRSISPHQHHLVIPPCPSLPPPARTGLHLCSHFLSRTCPHPATPQSNSTSAPSPQQVHVANNFPP